MPFSDLARQPLRERCGRITLGRRWWVIGVAAAFCLFATAAPAATFRLDNGETLEGEVIHATRNTFMIRETIGGIRQLSHNEVRSVEIRTQNGEIVSGVLLGWREGVYEVESGGSQIRIENRSILGEEEPAPPVLMVSKAAANEGAAKMEFKIDLSRPARRSIFVVYGTFDRTAKAGEDYREERGSLEFEPGDISAVVHVLLIDDDETESDETFEVFVSADKELATIKNKRAVGTILNDDD